MTSERRRAANRKNARKSTGPKSAQGKAKVSGNARRHGFSARGPADEHAPENLRRIADGICGEDADPIACDLAMTIADAQVSITRVRAARITVIKEARSRYADASAESASNLDGEAPPRNDLDSLCLAFPQLIALERYERRAIARRKRAIEQLNAIRQTRRHHVARV